MHTEIDYNVLQEPAKSNKAIEDIKEWLGPERFEEITKAFRAFPEPPPLSQFEMLVSVTGIQGFPVKAYYNYVYSL